MLQKYAKSAKMLEDMLHKSLFGKNKYGLGFDSTTSQNPKSFVALYVHFICKIE